MENKLLDMPLVQCLQVEAQSPSLQDNTADIDRLKQALQPVLEEFGLADRECKVPFSCLSRVAAGFRRCDFRGGAVVSLIPGVVEIIDFVSDSSAPLFAMALDLGTTHLEATVLDPLWRPFRQRTEDRYDRSC
jgi:hypothetical protein